MPDDNEVTAPPPVTPEPIAEVSEPTGWKPDFTQPDPWEGMPQEYVELEAAAFKPTEESPLPPSQRTPEGVVAREAAPAVSAEVAAIKLAPRSTPDKPILTRESYDAFQKLQDEQKFIKAQELGLIEEGAKFAPGLKVTYAPEVPEEERILKPREWGYYTAEQVAEMEKAEAEAKEVAEARVVGIEAAREAIEARQAREQAEFAVDLATFKNTHTKIPGLDAEGNEQWVSNEELNNYKDNFPEVYQAITTGGMPAAQVVIDRLQAEYDRQRAIRAKQYAALDILTSYAVAPIPDIPLRTGVPYEVGYNLVQFMIDSPDKEVADQTLLDAGFSREDIKAALLPPEVITEPEDTRNFIEKFNDAVIAVEDIAWQALTPWEEEKGESFVDYVKATPKRLLSPDTPDQATLKATYNDEQAAPLWARLLFADTVTYDKKNDQYVEIYLAVAPERKIAAVRAAQRVLTKTIEVNYNKLLKPKIIKPQVNWNNITQAIKSGQIRNASQAAKWVRLRSAAQIAATKAQQAQRVKSIGAAAAKARLAEKMRLAVEAATKASQLTALSSAIIMTVPSTGATIHWKPFRPGELTPAKMKELTAQWLAMKPSDAIKQINAANLVTAAVAYEPVAINKILLSAIPAQLHQTISRLQPNTQAAIRAGNLTKAQELAQTQLQIAQQQAVATAQALATATQAATEAMTQALIEGATLTEAETAAQIAAETATQTSTASEVASQIATQTAQQALLQQATSITPVTTVTLVTPIKPVTPVTPTTVISPTPIIPITPITPVTPVTPITPIITPIIPPPLPVPDVEPVRVFEAIAEGSYAFKMGLFWKYIPPPYDMDKPITLPRGVAPKGARVGGRTPQETIQMIGQSREVPRDISIDLGVVDAFITAGGTQITFTGKGLETDVGKRLPSPTKGMSFGIEEQIIEGGNEVEDRFGEPQQEGFVPAPRPVEPIRVEPIEPQVIEPEEEVVGTRNDLSDLFEVSEEDVMGADEDNLKQELGEEDMGDLFGVSEEDVMGEPEQPRRPTPKPRLIRRTNKYYPPPPTTLGGMR